MFAISYMQHIGNSRVWHSMYVNACAALHRPAVQPAPATPVSLLEDHEGHRPRRVHGRDVTFHPASLASRIAQFGWCSPQYRWEGLQHAREGHSGTWQASRAIDRLASVSKHFDRRETMRVELPTRMLP